MSYQAMFWFTGCVVACLYALWLWLGRREDKYTIANLRMGIDNANRRTEDTQRLLDEARALRRQDRELFAAWTARSVGSTVDVVVENDIVTLYTN